MALNKTTPFALIFILMTLGYSKPTYCQNSNLDTLEEKLESSYGVERIKVLNLLVSGYRTVKTKKSIRYGSESIELGRNILIANQNNYPKEDLELLVIAYYETSESLFLNEDFLEARSELKDGLEYAGSIESSLYVIEMELRLQEIQDKIDRGEVKDNFLNRTISDIKIGKTINRATADIGIATEVELAENQTKKGNFQSAIDHYEKAINLLRNKGDQERISEIKLEIAVLLDSLEQYQEAKIVLNQAIDEIEQDETVGLSYGTNSKLSTDNDKEYQNRDSLKKAQSDLKLLSEEYARNDNFEKSLEYYKLYEALTIQMHEDSIRSLEFEKRRENDIRILRQQKEISELKIEQTRAEKNKQIRIRNIATIAGIFVLFGLVVAVYFYIAKRKQHKALGIAHVELNETKDELEDAEKKISTLLSQQVSTDVATELITNSGENNGKRHFVCIMFLDIRDFTPIAEKLSPEELINYQNSIFGFILDIIESHQGVVNQLMGDGFMATFGAPISHGNDSQNAFNASIEILKAVDQRNTNQPIHKTRIGIGLHNGYVVTGNVGNDKRKQFSITGNPVIIASRIEQLNKTFSSQFIISEEVYNALNNRPEKPSFKEVQVKGRSDLLRVLVVA